LRGHAFNFSVELPLTVSEVVARISLAIGSTLEPVIMGDASHEIPQQFLSAAKAREQLDWQPLFSLDEGMRRTVDWYRAFFAS
jgi:CDP-glucose 4,6-dehydratase